MSAYITLATPMVDEECLLESLADLGFSRSMVEVHESAVALVGFDGAGRGRQGHVVIRRHHVGVASNDIGFERTPTGFRAHISDFDQRRYGPGWVQRLQDRYRHHDAAKREQLQKAREAAAVEARRLAEIEERRREEERRRLVEAQCAAIHDKARKLGYRVDETRQGDAVRLVLVKRVY